MPADFPSVCIVIAVYNCVNTISECLNSCLKQDYVHKKIVVIDGGSTDGTKDVLSMHSNDFEYWVSESDNGIYHAWNKALQVVTTDWVVFLGADDKWANDRSLTKMMAKACYPSVNFVCAKIYVMPFKNRNGRLFGEPWNYSRMKWRMTVGHTGMLHHISLFKEFGFFNEAYRIAGDYEFLLRTGKNIRAEYLPEPIVFMGGGGVSNTNLGVVAVEGLKALSESPDFGYRYGWLFYLRIYLKKIKNFIFCD